VGKIFDALEKFTKEAGPPKSGKIRNSDYDVLMQFDRSTGRIDMANPEVLKDARGIKRLMTYRLINDDGTLTPAGRAKYESMTGALGKGAPDGQPAIAESIAREKKADKKISSRFEKVAPLDWALLMNYDQRTGNLLKYDPETGQLDEESRKLLQDPATVQRLIDNQMILPGGWLTLEAKQECARREAEQAKKQTAEMANSDTFVEPGEPRQVLDSPAKLSQTDMELLLEHDPVTLKLDLQHPAIVKDPAIMKRLLDNKMIEAGGKLTPQALVRCRALTRFKREHEENVSLQKKPKPTVEEKPPKVAELSKAQKASEDSDDKENKIIPLKENEIKAKNKEEKTYEITHDLTTVAKAEKGAEPTVTAPSQKKFKVGKAQDKYASRAIDKDLVTLMNPQSFEAEQFKILRTNLLFPGSGKMPRSVMVTSVGSGDGKSFVAANLAISVAQHVNWNVLLIDCDLRRPSVHRQFGFQNTAGLSDYLTNGTDLQPLLLKTGIEKLTILPAGKPPDNPSELLSSERMAALLDEAATRYKDRLIILDSPPPKITAESGALAKYVDGVLLVVKYGSTPKNSAMDLINKLGKNKILGAVINNFDAGSSRYRKKYYGGEYFRQ
jgi:exopolysaccharide/PEP-CTERM locus tyrosine autokinase